MSVNEGKALRPLLDYAIRILSRITVTVRELYPATVPR